MTNIILNTDSYKASHYLQYPPNTNYISAYIESRGCEKYNFNKLLFFGLQAYIKKYLLKPITQEDIIEAKDILTNHGLPFNKDNWEYILKKHNGFLPLSIEAIPEGTILPLHNVITQVVNTDPKCFWLTTYIETSLIRAIWYPTTIASYSWHCKQIIKKYLIDTSDNLDNLDFKLHDFGARGTSSYESAEIGGCAHLVNFKGTDTISGIIAARKYYQEPMAGFSIPAAEHSTITSWGKDQESKAYENMLDQFLLSPEIKNKLVAVVSDSYDIWNAIEKIWGEKLKDKVINSGGVVIIRPDSGDPLEIVPKVIQKLMKIFGSYTNSKGYQVLPDFIRIIQGDGVNIDIIEKCLEKLKNLKISAENIAFGMGGALLQQVNRDTLSFAMKANARCDNNNKWHDVYKNPATDLHKNSKPGRLALIKKDNGEFQTIRKSELNNKYQNKLAQNKLVEVYKNGKLLIDDDLKIIRERANKA